MESSKTDHQHELMTCPKCGKQQPKQEMCRYCKVIIAKAQAVSPKKPTEQTLSTKASTVKSTTSTTTAPKHPPSKKKTDYTQKILMYLLFALALLSCLAGIGIFSIAESAVHEIEGMLCFIMFAIFLGSAAIVEAISKITKGQDEEMRIGSLPNEPILLSSALPHIQNNVTGVQRQENDMDFYEFSQIYEEIFFQLKHDDRMVSKTTKGSDSGNEKKIVRQYTNLLAEHQLQEQMLLITLFAILADKEQVATFEKVITSLQSFHYPTPEQEISFVKSLEALHILVEAFWTHHFGDIQDINMGSTPMVKP